MKDITQHSSKILKTTLSFLFLVSFLKGTSQTLNAPIKEFGSICASSSFNSYSANFDFNGFPAGTTFALEMSDPSGSFTTLTPIQIISSQFATSPGRFTFSVPATIATSGKKYKLRVKTTNYPTQVVSGSSQEFHAFYWVFNNRIKILDNGSGALAICGTSGKLSIDATAPSPLQFPDLKYVWIKDNGVIAGQDQKELTVTSPGTYSVQVDYGNCNSNIGFLAYSQDVVVSFTTSTSSYVITSSLGNNVCPKTPTILSTSAGQSYQWYRDNVKIDGATSYNYITDVAGTYKVVVGPGTACESTSSNFVLTAEDFNLNIDAKVLPSINYIEDGQNLTITATTSANLPTYEWFLPGGNSPVSTTDSYTITNPVDGEYRVVVTQNSACKFPKTIRFKVKIGVESTKIPNIISPIDENGENDTWILPDEYKAENVEVLIMDRYGKEVLRKVNYDDTWPTDKIEFKSINPIYYYVISKDGNPVKKGSITVIK